MMDIGTTSIPNIAQFSGQLGLLAVIYIFVLVIVALDLWAGIRKAKKRGEYRSSYGLRKTVEKICRYYNMMLVITAIDVVQMLAIMSLHEQGTTAAVPIFPVFSIIGAIFVGFIELKSIYEKAEYKEKAKITEAAKDLAKVAGTDGAPELLASVLKLLAEATAGSQAQRTEAEEGAEE